MFLERRFQKLLISNRPVLNLRKNCHPFNDGNFAISLSVTAMLSTQETNVSFFLFSFLIPFQVLRNDSNKPSCLVKDN
jgi:hypothetical protein